MRAGCVLAVVLAASGPALAEPAETEPSPKSNALSVQAGLLPNFSFVGVEFRRSLLARLDATVSASFGLAAVLAVIPHVTWPIGRRLTLSTGVGPSVAYEKGAPLEQSGHSYAQAIFDIELNLFTADAWILQCRAGASIYSESDETRTMPFVGLGIGRGW